MNEFVKETLQTVYNHLRIQYPHAERFTITLDKNGFEIRAEGPWVS